MVRCVRGHEVMMSHDGWGGRGGVVHVVMVDHGTGWAASVSTVRMAGRSVHGDIVVLATAVGHSQCNLGPGTLKHMSTPVQSLSVVMAIMGHSRTDSELNSPISNQETVCRLIGIFALMCLFHALYGNGQGGRSGGDQDDGDDGQPIGKRA